MAPNGSTTVTECPISNGTPNGLTPQKEYKRQIVWRNVLLFGYLHVAALLGAYLSIFSAKWLTVVWGKCSYFSQIITLFMTIF